MDKEPKTIAGPKVDTQKVRKDGGENTGPNSQPLKPLSEAEQHNAPEHEDRPRDFNSYYLRQVTAEFADDIEKLRNGPDFKESSVEILIQALKQHAANFSEEEKRKVMAQ